MTSMYCFVLVVQTSNTVEKARSSQSLLQQLLSDWPRRSSKKSAHSIRIAAPTVTKRRNFVKNCLSLLSKPPSTDSNNFPSNDSSAVVGRRTRQRQHHDVRYSPGTHLCTCVTHLCESSSWAVFFASSLNASLFCMLLVQGHKHLTLVIKHLTTFHRNAVARDGVGRRSGARNCVG